MSKRVRAVDKRTSDLIAASYAVPDLVVAVQEAVYNAIDAHARHLTVAVDLAQASFFITDDGEGIHPDAMYEHIFERGATSNRDRSKTSYGKGGTFLAAMATLAKEIEIESRIENYWTSFCKVIQTGRVIFNARSKTTRDGRGTSLRVSNLFWLLPVRQRDLEAHASSRARVARRLSSFFHSLSMIWPTLSIDVSFDDAKVPRCVIQGATTCEERLHAVFGDILGRELEYVSFDLVTTPFTVRGYVAVVRDGGSDGDGNLESPGWRQARAYYQFVFLDNLWLDDFQRSCCKTINSMAIQLELGIPIFVLKISAKSHEYDLHSDGSARVVNVKRPEMLSQMLQGFVQFLQSRVQKAEHPTVETADTKNDGKAMASTAVVDSVESIVPVSNEPVDLIDVGQWMKGVWDEEEPLHGFTEECQWTADTYMEKVEVDDDGGYDDGFDDLFRDDCPEQTETAFGLACEPQEFAFEYQLEHTGQWTEPSVEYVSDDRTAFYYEEAVAPRSDERHGCVECRSCGSHWREQPRYLDAIHEPLQLVMESLYTPLQLVMESLYTPQRFDCDEYGNPYEYELVYLDAVEVAPTREATQPTYHAQYAVDGYRYGQYELQEKQAIYQPNPNLHSAAPLTDPSGLSNAHIKQERDLDQLFFGKKLRAGGSETKTPAQKKLNQAACEDGGVQAKNETAWLSSRRLGAGTASSESSTVETAKSSNSDSNADRSSGSDQLSEYFSMEKLLETHRQSNRVSMSQWASKRVGVANTRHRIDEPETDHVRVGRLPRDLHDPSAKTMTLDKSIFQHLQVIRQVDRKFILVKVTTPSDAEDACRTLLLCIDQHAADERVRLEQLEAQVFGVNGDGRNIDVVEHETPLVLMLSTRELETLHFFEDAIRSWGFHFDMDGSDGWLTHTPKIDTRIANIDDLREYLQLLAGSDPCVASRVLRPPVITRFLHSRACRSAIMFGDYLSVSQCQDILDQLKECQLPFQCAHGRPSIVPLVELLEQTRGEE